MKTITAPTVEPITLDTLRMHCKVDGNADDALLAIYLGTAREWAESYLGFAVAPTTVESSYSAFPTGSIPLEASPVLSIVSVRYLNAAGVDTVLPTTVYSLDSGSVALTTAWPAVASGVRVRYVIGYSPESDATQAAPLPFSIKAALMLVAGHLYANREETTAASMEALPMGASVMLTPLRTRLGFA